ncbi:MAG: ABC transporter permease, partial [Bacteroidales bacterium]|nr:ABC transporter permease [Bacteroidales bacterium]
GILEPSSGTVALNGLDIVKDKEKLEGVMGLVPQDDLLIEELTVFENLYFAASQCFGGMDKAGIVSIVEKTLSSVGLADKRDLKIGTPLNKVISGGQRKRLNIALELIREPSVLFLDEPTSGLSSKDSENIIDLLRELTHKGKLVFTVIHQPSSDIFKMFDKMAILDQGGYLVYFGNPVDSVIHFKTLDYQVNAAQGECPSCGNVNPETIFKIIEAQVVDEFGNYTEKRKVKPKQWADRFKILNTAEPVKEVEESPEKNLNKPGRFRQYLLYMARDLKSKISNIQYVLLTLIEAPVLAFILAFIIRYIPDPESDVYHFSDNENIPVYIFMSIIVAVFLGLTISAEEIFRDRNILRRERFLNLSRSSYLLSKVTILMGISAIQCLLFVIVANPILGIEGMSPAYWLALFGSAFTANMIGLIISASFNSVITIYIVIPLLLIPMMVLSGAMFSFDKLNRTISRPDKVPLVAELMPTRWSYEALMVSQFKDNRYSSLVYTADGETFYSLQKKISQADFNSVHRIPELREVLRDAAEKHDNPEKIKSLGNDLSLIRKELAKIPLSSDMVQFDGIDALYPGKFNNDVTGSLDEYFDELSSIFNKQIIEAERIKDEFVSLNREKLKALEKDYYNYKLEEIVTRYYDPDKIIKFKNSLIQNTDPVYLDPPAEGFLKFRTHFFAPSKNIFGMRVDTYAFNVTLLFINSFILYLILYFDLLSLTVKFIARFRNLKKD